MCFTWKVNYIKDEQAFLFSDSCISSRLIVLPLMFYSGDAATFWPPPLLYLQYVQTQQEQLDLPRDWDCRIPSSFSSLSKEFFFFPYLPLSENSTPTPPPQKLTDNSPIQRHATSISNSKVQVLWLLISFPMLGNMIKFLFTHSACIAQGMLTGQGRDSWLTR